MQKKKKKKRVALSFLFSFFLSFFPCLWSWTTWKSSDLKGGFLGVVVDFDATPEEQKYPKLSKFASLCCC
ncbi:hypothetical protein Ahy_B06g084464 isoform H [Arachis hypogaea]|uniref:Uncharacterized protein n=1 Tax=Arachis hypogaea TaxID=3818 RepID=A0A444YRZ0_ARAHY|nr:hypothetical protein Ahy_B06g084464 isoform H [Arachis hypogaea]